MSPYNNGWTALQSESFNLLTEGKDSRNKSQKKLSPIPSPMAFTSIFILRHPEPEAEEGRARRNFLIHTVCVRLSRFLIRTMYVRAGLKLLYVSYPSGSGGAGEKKKQTRNQLSPWLRPKIATFFPLFLLRWLIHSVLY